VRLHPAHQDDVLHYLGRWHLDWTCPDTAQSVSILTLPRGTGFQAVGHPCGLHDAVCCVKRSSPFARSPLSLLLRCTVVETRRPQLRLKSGEVRELVVRFQIRIQTISIAPRSANSPGRLRAFWTRAAASGDREFVSQGRVIHLYSYYSPRLLASRPPNPLQATNSCIGIDAVHVPHRIPTQHHGDHQWPIHARNGQEVIRRDSGLEEKN
jgi:hypothetical protein